MKVNIIGEVVVPGIYAQFALNDAQCAVRLQGPSQNGSFRSEYIPRRKKLATFDIYNFLINGSEKAT